MRVVDHAMARLVVKWKLILVTRVHSERRSRRVSPSRGVSLDQERGIRCARSSKVEQRGGHRQSTSSREGSDMERTGKEGRDPGRGGYDVCSR